MLNIKKKNIKLRTRPVLAGKANISLSSISVRHHNSVYIGTAFLALYYKHYIVAGAAAVLFGVQTYVLIKNNRVSDVKDLTELHANLTNLSLELNQCIRHMKDIYIQSSALQSTDGIRVIGHIRDQNDVFLGVHISVSNNLDYLSQDTIYGIGKSLARLSKDYLEGVDVRRIIHDIHQTEQSIKLLDPNYVEQLHILWVRASNVARAMSGLNQVMSASHNVNSYVLSVYL